MGAFLAAITLLLYAPVARHSFIDLDDDAYVFDNTHVLTGLSLANARWAFTTGYAGNWHPVTWLSHMLDCQLFGAGPGPQHVVNSMLHAVNSVLLFLLLARLTGRPWRSAFVAALFALHPLHVESVAWIAERKDVLSAFFFMLTLGAYARYVEKSQVPSLRSQASSSDRHAPVAKSEFQGAVSRGAVSGAPAKPGISRRGSDAASSIKNQTSNIKNPAGLYYGVALLTFALGLMSKPMLVTLPFLLMLLDYWPLVRFQRPNPSSRPSSLKGLLIEKTPFFVLAAASCVVTFLVQRNAGAVASMQSVPLVTRSGNAALSYVQYLAKILWPRCLLIPYIPEPDQGVALALLAGCMLVLVTVLPIKLGARHRYLPVGWLWFLGSLIPVIGIVQVGIQSMADRYTYLPSIGIFIIVAWSAADVTLRWRIPRAVTVTLSTVALCACAFLTSRQLAYWKNSETLFSHSFAKDPTSLPVANLLAWTYAADPDPKLRNGAKAIRLAEACVQVTHRQEPTYLDTLAAAYAESGQFSAALKTANEALELMGPQDHSQFAADLKSRIECYKAGKPVHAL
ncbi:MAG TPA: hypothetical protein VNZ64_09830 [Candidatus Acidoferrum sp.]|nr:hypothetical protein [Candidatus Acidoferrum sp.]